MMLVMQDCKKKRKLFFNHHDSPLALRPELRSVCCPLWVEQHQTEVRPYLNFFKHYETKTNWLWNMKWCNYVAPFKIESPIYISHSSFIIFKRLSHKNTPTCGELKFDQLKVCAFCNFRFTRMAGIMENKVWCSWVWNGFARGRGSRLMSCHT